MKIEKSPTPMTWANAIDYAISKGKEVANAATIEYLLKNNIITRNKTFPVWSSNTAYENIFNAVTLEDGDINKDGIHKNELFDFYMVDSKDQMKSDQDISYRVGDV